MEKQIPSVTSQVVESKRDEKSGLFRKKTNDISISITELQNLQNDYINQTKSHSAKQEAYAYSLRQQNKILNQELQNLVLQLHFHIDKNIDNQVANINHIEQRILRTISFSMIIGCVLLIVSYFIIHNIRGPLNAISGSTELEMSTCEKEKRNIYLENIQQSCAHILHLVNALLNMYRLNEAKETVNLVSFDLQKFLERIADNYHQQANNKGLLFNDNFVHTHRIVEGDANRIEQILDNLVSNAIKFTSTGRITFSSRYHINRLYIKVSDTGKGMTKEEVNRLFNPFERSDTNDSIEGFGLGLAITKGLIKLLDGTIKAKSILGKVSTFMVSVPLPVSTET